jgi:hypothetical protein
MGLTFTTGHNEAYGDPDRIRTCDPQIRNLMLYPTELRGLSRRLGLPAYI